MNTNDTNNANIQMNTNDTNNTNLPMAVIFVALVWGCILGCMTNLHAVLCATLCFLRGLRVKKLNTEITELRELHRDPPGRC